MVSRRGVVCFENCIGTPAITWKVTAKVQMSFKLNAIWQLITFTLESGSSTHLLVNRENKVKVECNLAALNVYLWEWYKACFGMV